MSEMRLKGAVLKEKTIIERMFLKKIKIKIKALTQKEKRSENFKNINIDPALITGIY